MKLFYKYCLSLLMIITFLGNMNVYADGELEILTSFYPVYSITEYISGDLNQIDMIQSQRGIHGFEPSAQDIRKMEAADIFIYHSRTLESWTGNLPFATNEAVLIEATEGVDLKRTPGLEDFKTPAGMDEKSLYDPHSWLDPILVAQEGQVIADALSRIDPDNQLIYQENANKLAEEAQQIVDTYLPLFENKDQRVFVTEHTAFQYLADRFGLEQIGIAGINDSDEPGSRKMTEIIQLITENDIPVIFTETGSSGKIAQTVAKEVQIPVAVLNPLEASPDNDKNILENIQIQLEVLNDYLK